MQKLYNKINEINDVNIETGQKIETIIHEIFSYYKKEEKVPSIKIIKDLGKLKELYQKEIPNNSTWLAISNINNWLSMDEEWLQNFRKTLDTNGTKVRIICKPQGTKYEPSGLKNREIKTLPNKYLLSSNIDILSDGKVIITNPFFQHLGIVSQDKILYKLIKKLFFDLWNGNQYIVGVTAGDSLCTESWISIMTSGKNYGIDCVINPILYPKIFDKVKAYGGQKIVDFGCGLNTLGMQLLYGIPSQIEGLKGVDNIEKYRKNIKEYVGYEANETFVEEAIKYAGEVEAEELKIIWKELIKNNALSHQNKSVDICISRNFIVHLNYDDFEYHLSEVARILKDGGTYILATLNPGYEHMKYYNITGDSLIDGDRYNHYHGNTGELGTWVQYYKTRQNLENYVKKYFAISSVDYCMPINDDAKESHPLYYNKTCPMGIIYTLVK